MSMSLQTIMAEGRRVNMDLGKIAQRLDAECELLLSSCNLKRKAHCFTILARGCGKGGHSSLRDFCLGSGVVFIPQAKGTCGESCQLSVSTRVTHTETEKWPPGRSTEHTQL